MNCMVLLESWYRLRREGNGPLELVGLVLVWAVIAHSTECAVLEVACLHFGCFQYPFLMSIDLH